MTQTCLLLSCLTLLLLLHDCVRGNDNVTQPVNRTEGPYILLLLPITFCQNSRDCNTSIFTGSNLVCNTAISQCTCADNHIWNDPMTRCEETVRCITNSDCPHEYHCSFFECVPNGKVTKGFWYIVFAVPVIITFCYCIKCCCCRDTRTVASCPANQAINQSAISRPARRPSATNASQAVDLPHAYQSIPPSNQQSNNTPPPPYEVAINLPKVDMVRDY